MLALHIFAGYVTLYMVKGPLTRLSFCKRTNRNKNIKHYEHLRIKVTVINTLIFVL